MFYDVKFPHNQLREAIVTADNFKQTSFIKLLKDMTIYEYKAANYCQTN